MRDTGPKLTSPQFDMLDRLHTLDAHLYPIGRENLALELGDISPEAAHLRMLRLKKVGLVEVIQECRQSPAFYRLTARGTHLYRAELQRMDGVTAPPSLPASMQRALEATTLLHMTEPRTMTA